MTERTFSPRILAETDEIIAWNKPPGLLTSGKDLDDPNCAQYRAMEYTDDMVWVLHQLDRDTSGVLLLAKKKGVISEWQQIWDTWAVEKFYVALVHGRLGESPMVIDAPIRRLGRRGYTEVEVHEDGKPAKTRVCELSAAKNYSLVLARGLTGRTHQIRVHLQHVGCPLIGEERYNSIPCGFHDRHALHALAILTDHPAPLDDIEAPLPDDLRDVAGGLDVETAPLENWRDYSPVA